METVTQAVAAAERTADQLQDARPRRGSQADDKSTKQMSKVNRLHVVGSEKLRGRDR